jgi:hypothetical protein
MNEKMFEEFSFYERNVLSAFGYLPNQMVALSTDQVSIMEIAKHAMILAGLPVEEPNIAFSSYFHRTIGISREECDRVLKEIKANFNKQKPGYRKGVILVPIDPAGYSVQHVEITKDTLLFADYKPRVLGEEPRKVIHALVETLPQALFMDVVLYSHQTLMEKNEASAEADWEIITMLPKLIEDEPMHPDTLIANHIGLSGGTDTKMSSVEFEIALTESVNYWKNRVNAVESCHDIGRAKQQLRNALDYEHESMRFLRELGIL